MTQARPYAGMEAADREARRRTLLLESGLELLGNDLDPAALTVRGICQQAGLATRYFYESFADKQHFIGSVFDWVIAELATTRFSSSSPADMWIHCCIAPPTSESWPSPISWSGESPRPSARGWAEISP